MTYQPIETLVSEMKAAAEAATPGEWGRKEPHRLSSERGVCSVETGALIAGFLSENNAAYIALANPANVLTLLASHTAQAEEIKALKESADEHALFDAEADQAFKDLDHQVSTLSTKLVEAEKLNELLRREAEMHAQEARTHKSSLHQAYQIVSGATGEPGNWNGAEPIRAYVDAAEAKLVESEAREGALREACERVELQSSNVVFNLSQKYARSMDNAEALRTFKHFAEITSAALTLKGRS